MGGGGSKPEKGPPGGGGELTRHSKSSAGSPSGFTTIVVAPQGSERHACLQLREKHGSPWAPDRKFRQWILSLWTEAPETPSAPLDERLLQDIMFHAKKSRVMAARSRGRLEQLARVSEFLCNAQKSHGPVPCLLLCGASGQGKTSLLGRAIAQVSKDLLTQGVHILYREVTKSTSALRLATSLCKQLGVPAPRSPMDIAQSLTAGLRTATPQNPVVLVLDGLDRFSQSTDRELRWLIRVLSAPSTSVIAVFTCVHKFSAPSEIILRRSLPALKVLDIPGLGQEEDLRELEIVFGLQLSSLSEDQYRLLESAFDIARKDFDGATPFLINLVGEIFVKPWINHPERSGFLPQYIPSSTAECLDISLDMLEKDIADTIGLSEGSVIRDLLALISVARDGLSTSELEALSPGLNVASALSVAEKHGVVMPFSNSGIELWVWSHKSCAEVGNYRYLGVQRSTDWNTAAGECAELLSRYAGKVAEYFSSFIKSPNSRTLRELPRAFTLSKKWDNLESLLFNFPFLEALILEERSAVIIAHEIKSFIGSKRTNISESAITEKQFLKLNSLANILLTAQQEIGTGIQDGVIDSVWSQIKRSNLEFPFNGKENVITLEVDRESNVNDAIALDWDTLVVGSDDLDCRATKLACSYDGQMVIAVVGKNEVRAFILRSSFTEIWSETVGEDIESTAISPSNLVAIGTNSSIQLFTAHTGQRVVIIAPLAGTPTLTHTLKLTFLHFTTDGTLLTSAKFGQIIRWDPRSNNSPPEFIGIAKEFVEEGRSSDYRAAQFVSHGELFVWWSRAKGELATFVAFSIDLSQKRKEDSLVKQLWRNFDCLVAEDSTPVFSGSGSKLISCGSSELVAYSAVTGAVEWKVSYLKAGAGEWCAACSLGGDSKEIRVPDRVFGVTRGGWFVEVNSDSGKVLRRFRGNLAKDQTVAQAFTRRTVEGDRYYVSTQEGLVIVGAVPPMTATARESLRPTSKSPIASISFSSEGSIVVTDSSTLNYLLPLQTSEPPIKMESFCDGNLVQACQDGPYYVQIFAEGKIAVRKKGEGTSSYLINHDSAVINGFICVRSIILLDSKGMISAYSADAQTDSEKTSPLWAVSAKNTVNILRLSTQDTFYSVSATGLTQRHFTKNGQVEANVVPGPGLFREGLESARVSCVGISTDGALLAMGDTFGDVYLVPLDGDKMTRKLRLAGCHDGRVGGVGFVSQQNRILITGGGDSEDLGSIKVWQVDCSASSAACRGTIGLGSQVTCISSDGVSGGVALGLQDGRFLQLIVK